MKNTSEALNICLENTKGKHRYHNSCKSRTYIPFSIIYSSFSNVRQDGIISLGKKEHIHTLPTHTFEEYNLWASSISWERGQCGKLARYFSTWCSAK